MFKELKMKIAARRAERKKARNAAARKARRNEPKTTRAQRAWDIICRPFRAIARILRNLWIWIRSIDLIGLVNLTLLVAIIALFSMLIIDILNCRRTPVVVVAKNPDIVATGKQNTIPNPNVRTISARPTTLPIARDNSTRKPMAKPINVRKEKKCPAAEKQIARVNKNIFGDTIIDSRDATYVLSDDIVVNGSLYLQNMRKYTLPCNITVRGNLFLRDVNMLQFCGDFTVTGNIYVSPRSSFGPIPSTARIGGQVVM